MKNPSQPSAVKCPSCAKKAPWDTSNPFRPFCSSVCKEQDFMAWANEELAIPGSPMGEGSEWRDEDPRNRSE